MSIVLFTVIILLLTLVIGLLIVNHDTPVIKQTRYRDIEAINYLLPQTQCGDCGYPGCQPYAEALANHTTETNRCLPGGMETVQALSKLLGSETKPLYKDSNKNETTTIALIDETLCIGCVKCITACPVDAILGAPKQMHSVIDRYCTGCELCIAPCPVDCISMVAAR